MADTPPPPHAPKPQPQPRGLARLASPTDILEAALDKAVSIPFAAIRRHVDAVRARNPEMSPAQVLRLLEREYVMTIQVTGGAVGAAAAAPAVGTGVALALTSADVATFFGASAVFALAVADVHGIEVTDVARRRALLLATVLGEDGAKAVNEFSPGSSGAWGRVLLTRMPTTTIRKVNSVLTKRFITSRLKRQGALALGRILPFGVGAVVGVLGARALGKVVISSSRKAFGPPPERFVVREIELGSTSAPYVIGTRTTQDGADLV